MHDQHGDPETVHNLPEQHARLLDPLRFVAEPHADGRGGGNACMIGSARSRMDLLQETSAQNSSPMVSSAPQAGLGGDQDRVRRQLILGKVAHAAWHHHLGQESDKRHIGLGADSSPARCAGLRTSPPATRPTSSTRRRSRRPRACRSTLVARAPVIRRSASSPLRLSSSTRARGFRRLRGRSRPSCRAAHRPVTLQVAPRTATAAGRSNSERSSPAESSGPSRCPCVASFTPKRQVARRRSTAIRVAPAAPGRRTRQLGAIALPMHDRRHLPALRHRDRAGRRPRHYDDGRAMVAATVHNDRDGRPMVAHNVLTDIRVLVPLSFVGDAYHSLLSCASAIC